MTSLQFALLLFLLGAYVVNLYFLAKDTNRFGVVVISTIVPALLFILLTASLSKMNQAMEREATLLKKLEKPCPKYIRATDVHYLKPKK